MELTFPLAFLLRNPQYVFWGFQVIVGLYFAIKDKWIWGFKIFPFGISTKNLNGTITSLGQRLRDPIKMWMAITRAPISWASVFFLPSLLVFFTLTMLLQQLRSITSFVLEQFGHYSIIDFDSLLFWLAVLISFIVHEIMHGIVAAAHEIKIKTVGILVIPNFLYAAYVQIEYEQFTKTEKIEPPESIEQSHADIQTDYFQKTMEFEQLQSPRSAKHDPFDVEDDYKRRILQEVLAAGLTGNLLLFSIGLILQLIIGPIEFAKFLVGSNLLLIGLNLFPIVFFDGGKLLPLTLKGRISDTNLKVVRRIINYLTLMLIFLAL